MRIKNPILIAAGLQVRPSVAARALQPMIQSPFANRGLFIF